MWCYSNHGNDDGEAILTWSWSHTDWEACTVHPATVDLKGRAYELLRQKASSFLVDDMYRNPGPLQFEGPGAEVKPFSLCVW
ncbi:pyrophosphate--fructose 6-phosphate 1-phosphotransferase subunit alpha [Iris pallida]|uniref:Pyrophosphate--fructose 6-phosphate 1-phosphotransferase subunit alpha n=1 Tax=Iris pallida TaxID=29817 RepID=A0AAX6INT3_IRIPA|nr:pyrophosphate--fructose 6-phosphate 1-phosphotransferase subunit alpha [Iris pallida]